MTRFAANLSELLKRRRMSQERLGDAIGLSQAMIFKWTRGTNTPDIQQAADVAGVFDVPIDMLILEDLTIITDREIEERRALAVAVATVGIKEAQRRLLVVGPKADGKPAVNLNDVTETGTKSAAVSKRRGGAG